MDSKDMITLFVPILFNGVILFVFQKMLNVKFEENNVKNQLKKQIYQNYFVKLQKLYNDINVCLEGKLFLGADFLETEYAELDVYAEEFENIKLHCLELHSYYGTYKKLLDEKSILKEKHIEMTGIIEKYGKNKDRMKMYQELCSVVDEINEQAVEMLLL